MGTMLIQELQKQGWAVELTAYRLLESIEEESKGQSEAYTIHKVGRHRPTLSARRLCALARKVGLKACDVAHVPDMAPLVRHDHTYVLMKPTTASGEKYILEFRIEGTVKYVRAHALGQAVDVSAHIISSRGSCHACCKSCTP